ncbi:TPA: hypothetical protein ENS27_13980, partial [bacterium]|nr:hypothetical protein [bacterium]
MKAFSSFPVVIFIMLYAVCGIFAQEWYPIGAGLRTWDADLRDVFFVNEQNGWIVGDQGMIIHTDNGGSWNEQESGISSTLNAVYFINQNEGWVIGNYGVILHTTNAGNTWILSQSDTNESLFDIHFLTENIGWIVGSNGVILHTEDGGNNWSKSTYGTNDLYAVHFGSVNNGWVVGKNGTVIHWNGSKWEVENVPVKDDLYEVYYRNSDDIWAV